MRPSGRASLGAAGRQARACGARGTAAAVVTQEHVIVLVAVRMAQYEPKARVGRVLK